MSVLNEEVREQLTQILQKMQNEVKLISFTEAGEELGEDLMAFMSEISELNEKLSFTPMEYSKTNPVPEITRYGIERAPSFLVLNSKGEDKGMRFYGLPSGYEINSFLSAVIEQSGVEEDLPEELTERIKAISEPMNIKVFVTMSCPHCPGAVQKAHKMAMLNPLITAEMIGADIFDELSNQYNVSSVPQIVFNDSESFLGNQPLDVFVETMEKVTLK